MARKVAASKEHSPPSDLSATTGDHDVPKEK